MTKATNVMSIAPNQPTTTRRLSPNTQPKYKTPARAGKGIFGATLDKVQSKIDELKQNIQDLQDTSKKLAQVEGEQPQPPPDTTTDTATETPAQGTSDTPQDAEKAIKNEELGIRNASEISAVAEDVKPADIFFVEAQPANVTKPLSEDAPQKISAEVQAPVAENFIKPPAPIEAAPVSLDASADLVDEQPLTPLIAANVPAYLFNANTATLLETKPATQAEAPKVDSVQNLMSVMPQADNSNAQSMLNMLGGRAWRPVDIQAQPIDVQPAQVQPSNVTLHPMDAPQVPTAQTLSPRAEVRPAQIQPTIQAQSVDVKPATIQPTVQAQPVDVKPATIQPFVQVQAQPVDVEQPAQAPPFVQVQAQPVDVEQPAQAPPSVQVQARPVDIEQPAQAPPSVQVQAQPVDIEQPAQAPPSVQVQAQPVDVEQPAQAPPSVQVQTRPVDVEQPATIQPTVQVQARPVDVQPAQAQPSVQVQARPVDIEQPATIQPSVQAQARPVDVEQPAQAQPTVQAQARPVDIEQPATIQPTVQAQAQSVDVQPGNVTLHPTDAPEVPTVQTLSPRAEVPTVQAQAQAQPLIAPQRVDDRPAQQIFSEMLGVNVQVEDAPTAAPVTAPQASPQQFNQQPQRDAQQNFQGQNFQATPDAAPQPQAVTTGGEIFVPNVTPQADAPQVQQTTPAQAPDASPMPQDDFDVPAQIVRQARLIRTTESTEMVIKLNPEHLGELTLRVSVSANGAVNASFHSDNAQVRTIIENALVQLRQELNDAGLKVENVDVYAGLSEGGGLLNGQGGQAWQQGRQQRQGNRQLDLNTIERDVDATAPVNESTTDGVDYSV